MATSSSTSGIGFFGLLAIVFIFLKLTDKIAWSWFWVLSPLFAGLAIFIVIVIVVLIIAILKK